MMKRKVYTDANGSSLIAIEGKGEYLPVEEFLQIQRENAELKARVEQLRLAALNAISFMSGGQAKADLRDAYDSAPSQCLAEIKAQAVEEYCASFESMCVNQLDDDDVTQDVVDGWKAGIMDCRIAGRKYANQLRQPTTPTSQGRQIMLILNIIAAILILSLAPHRVGEYQLAALAFVNVYIHYSRIAKEWRGKSDGANLACTVSAICYWLALAAAIVESIK